MSRGNDGVPASMRSDSRASGPTGRAPAARQASDTAAPSAAALRIQISVSPVSPLPRTSRTATPATVAATCDHGRSSGTAPAMRCTSAGESGPASTMSAYSRVASRK